MVEGMRTLSEDQLDLPTGVRQAEIRHGVQDDEFRREWHFVMRLESGEKYGGYVDLDEPFMHKGQSGFDRVYYEMERLVTDTIRKVVQEEILGTE